MMGLPQSLLFVDGRFTPWPVCGGCRTLPNAYTIAAPTTGTLKTVVTMAAMAAITAGASAAVVMPSGALAAVAAEAVMLGRVQSGSGGVGGAEGGGGELCQQLKPSRRPGAPGRQQLL